MIRRIIHIDQDKCNGCGACAKACHEGAIDMVDGKAVKTYVTTDLFDDTQISVTEGIQPGDTVITSWSPKLMNGVEVTAPVKAEE